MQVRHVSAFGDNSTRAGQVLTSFGNKPNQRSLQRLAVLSDRTGDHRPLDPAGATPVCDRQSHKGSYQRYAPGGYCTAGCFNPNRANVYPILNDAFHDAPLQFRTPDHHRSAGGTGSPLARVVSEVIASRAISWFRKCTLPSTSKNWHPPG